MKDWPFPVLYLRFAQVSAEMKLMVWLRRTCSEWRIWSILGNGNWHSSQKWRCSIWSEDRADKRETSNILTLILFILQFKWKCVLWMLNYFLLSQFNMQRQLLISYFVCCISLELGKHCCLFKNPDQFSIATLAQPIARLIVQPITDRGVFRRLVWKQSAFPIQYGEWCKNRTLQL